MIKQHTSSSRLRKKKTIRRSTRKRIDESNVEIDEEEEIIEYSLSNTGSTVRTPTNVSKPARKEKERINKGSRKQKNSKNKHQKFTLRIIAFLKKHRNFLEKTFMVLLEIAIRIIRNLM